MKKILILFITLISLSAKSQTTVYHSFPDSNANWCLHVQWYDGTCDHTEYGTIYFGNDTVINGNVYHILRQTGFVYSSLCGGGGYYYFPSVAVIRQDTLQHKVFMYDNSIGHDTIFYDFNLHIGDTLDKSKVNWGNGPLCIITSIDSILLNGQYRNRYNFSGSSGCPDSSIIEGIGSISGLMSLPSSCFEYFSTLTNFEQNGISIYQPGGAGCMVVPGIKNIFGNNVIQIYPNPITEKLCIITGNNDVSEIYLYDITSRIVIQQKFTNTITLNTERLGRGIYFYALRSKNGLIQAGRIVKE